MKIRRTIENKICSTASLFGYQEIGTPTFEDAELFIRKSGQEIVGQLYLFKDKSERELVLRPELTAPVIRFYANELYKLPKPLKVYYFGNCFRYERPQKGRFREFWQFGAELIGTDKPEGIAELIAFACTCLSNVGLTKYNLRVGYLEILKEILKSWEIFGTAQHQFFTALDKGDVDTLRNMLEDVGRTQDEIEDFFELVMKNFSSHNYNERIKLLNRKFSGIDNLLARLGKVIDFLKLFEIKDFSIDLGIARGLDYYTGIVFEIDEDSLGAEKQVCGGGEYSLGEIFELKDAYCSGFAIGFDRVVLAYELEGLTQEIQDLDAFVIPLSEPGLIKAVELVKQLRDSRLKVDIDIKGRNMSKNLKYASNKLAQFTIFIGEDEIKKGTLLIRQMKTGDQVEVEFENIIDYLKKSKFK